MDTWWTGYGERMDWWWTGAKWLMDKWGTNLHSSPHTVTRCSVGFSPQGWLPKSLVNQALPQAQLNFTRHLRRRLKRDRKWTIAHTHPTGKIRLKSSWYLASKVWMQDQKPGYISPPSNTQTMMMMTTMTMMMI